MWKTNALQRISHHWDIFLRCFSNRECTNSKKSCGLRGENLKKQNMSYYFFLEVLACSMVKPDRLMNPSAFSACREEQKELRKPDEKHFNAVKSAENNVSVSQVPVWSQQSVSGQSQRMHIAVDCALSICLVAVWPTSCLSVVWLYAYLNLQLHRDKGIYIWFLTYKRCFYLNTFIWNINVFVSK